MIIDCISDLHGFYPELEGGDLLVVAGDWTARDTWQELNQFRSWLFQQTRIYKRIVYIAGNHDGGALDTIREVNGHKLDIDPPSVTYLEDSGMEFEGLKIWGSPWTPPFCDWHFMLPEEKLKEKYDMIPFDTDILITHGPPRGILDTNSRGIHCGSIELRKAIERIGPKYAIFGHIHESYGTAIARNYRPLGHQEDERFVDTTCINCSHCDEHYIPRRKPIRIEL